MNKNNDDDGLCGLPRWLHHARKVSMKNPCNFPFGAVLVSGGRPIVVGHNKPYKTSRITRRHFSRGVHCEVNILEHGGENIKGSTLYIFRRGVGGISKIAKPCTVCQFLLKAHGVSKVVYSINDAPYYETMKL